jgi:hypothetical protein
MNKTDARSAAFLSPGSLYPHFAALHLLRKRLSGPPKRRVSPAVMRYSIIKTIPKNAGKTD